MIKTAPIQALVCFDNTRMRPGSPLCFFFWLQCCLRAPAARMCMPRQQARDWARGLSLAEAPGCFSELQRHHASFGHDFTVSSRRECPPGAGTCTCVLPAGISSHNMARFIQRRRLTRVTVTRLPGCQQPLLGRWLARAEKSGCRRRRRGMSLLAPGSRARLSWG